MSGNPPDGGYQGPADYPPGGGVPPGGYPAGAGGYPPPGSPGAYPQGPGNYPPPGYGQGQRPKVRPGRVWYLLALALIVAGVVWLIVGLSSIISSVNNLQRVPAPGRGTITLTHSGGFTVYYEGPGAQSNNIPALHVNVTPATPGARVTGLTQYSSSLTYHINSHSGRAVLTLHVTEAGRYTVTVVGQRAAGADLAIGKSITSGIVGTVGPSIPLILLGIFAAILLFIIRFIRKRSMRSSYT